MECARHQTLIWGCVVDQKPYIFIWSVCKNDIFIYAGVWVVSCEIGAWRAASCVPRGAKPRRVGSLRGDELNLARQPAAGGSMQRRPAQGA